MKDNDSQYRDIFSQAAVGIGYCDQKGNIVGCNQKICDMFGYSLKELLTMSVQDLIHPEDRGLHVPLLRKLWSREIESFSLERRYLHKTGKVVWAYVTVSLRLSPNDTPKHTIAILQDVTARKQAELSLEAKTQVLNRFFSVALDLFCIATTEGYFLRLNPQWEKALGYRPEDLEGARMLDFVHREDIESTQAVLAELKNQQPIASFENRFRHRDGSYRWIEWRSSPVNDLIYAAARDITERRQQELALTKLSEELAEWRDRYDIAARASGQVLFQYDLLTGSDTWGPNTLEILGYTDQEMPQGIEAYVEHVHPDDRDLFRRILEADATNTEPYRAEFRFRKADGAYLWVEERGMTRFNADGKPIQVIGHLIDISDRKQAELQLQELNVQFQNLARTDSLTQVSNRRHFADVLRREWGRLQRDCVPLVIVMLDIDYFKAYNDRYGHLAGDACLKKVASELERNLYRSGDLVARYGGEEFVLLLPDTDKAGAIEIVERIQQAIARLAIPHESSSAASIVSLSLGVAIVSMPTDMEPDAVLSEADKALYQAKQTRNTYCITVVD